MIEGEVTRNSNASSSNATNGHTGPSLETTIDLTFKASVTHVYLLGKMFGLLIRDSCDDTRNPNCEKE